MKHLLRLLVLVSQVYAARRRADTLMRPVPPRPAPPRVEPILPSWRVAPPHTPRGPDVLLGGEVEWHAVSGTDDPRKFG